MGPTKYINNKWIKVVGHMEFVDKNRVWPDYKPLQALPSMLYIHGQYIDYNCPLFS